MLTQRVQQQKKETTAMRPRNRKYEADSDYSGDHDDIDCSSESDPDSNDAGVARGPPPAIPELPSIFYISSSQIILSDLVLGNPGYLLMVSTVMKEVLEAVQVGVEELSKLRQEELDAVLEAMVERFLDRLEEKLERNLEEASSGDEFPESIDHQMDLFLRRATAIYGEQAVQNVRGQVREQLRLVKPLLMELVRLVIEMARGEKIDKDEIGERVGERLRHVSDPKLRQLLRKAELLYSNVLAKSSRSGLPNNLLRNKGLQQKILQNVQKSSRTIENNLNLFIFRDVSRLLLMAAQEEMRKHVIEQYCFGDRMIYDFFVSNIDLECVVFFGLRGVEGETAEDGGETQRETTRGGAREVLVVEVVEVDDSVAGSSESGGRFNSNHGLSMVVRISGGEVVVKEQRFSFQ
jgi:hypothetical protein